MAPEMKQVLVLDTDIDMSTGKQISQAAHASLGAYRKAGGEDVSEWESQGMKKIAVSAGERSLEDLYRAAERKDISAFLVRDAGMTEVEPGTVTALGIGPAEADKIDEITGELELIN